MRSKFPEMLFALGVIVAGTIIIWWATHQDPAAHREDVVSIVDLPTTTTAPPGPSLEEYASAVTLSQFADAYAGWQLESYAAAWNQAHAPKPPASKPASPAPTHAASSSDESFRQCVMVRESSRNYSSVGGGMYGIIDPTWRAMHYDSRFGAAHSWLASPAAQDAAFWDLLAKSGRHAWSPYDGC